jgi:hypothetical protein
LWTRFSGRVVNTFFVRASENPRADYDTPDLVSLDERKDLRTYRDVIAYVSHFGKPLFQFPNWLSLAVRDSDDNFGGTSVVSSVERDRAYRIPLEAPPGFALEAFFRSSIRHGCLVLESRVKVSASG